MGALITSTGTVTVGLWVTYTVSGCSLKIGKDKTSSQGHVLEQHSLTLQHYGSLLEGLIFGQKKIESLLRKTAICPVPISRKRWLLCDYWSCKCLNLSKNTVRDSIRPKRWSLYLLMTTLVKTLQHFTFETTEYSSGKSSVQVQKPRLSVLK
jgi:hypothetical protein